MVRSPTGAESRMMSPFAARCGRAGPGNGGKGRGKPLLDQARPPESTDRPPAALVEAARIRTSLVLVGIACLVACLALLGDGLRTEAYARFSLDPVFIRLASSVLAILA